MTQTASRPVSRFVSDTLEITAVSGRKYVLRQINALEQMNADSISDNMQASMYYRVAMSIESIDGQKQPPGNSDLVLNALLENIPGSDMNELILAVVKWTVPQAADLKNESAPAG
jgi:hypothetical protein